MVRKLEKNAAQLPLFAEEVDAPMRPPETVLLTLDNARQELNEELYTRYMHSSLKQLSLISRNVSLLMNVKAQERVFSKRGKEGGAKYIEDVRTKTGERLSMAQIAYAEALGYTVSGQQILAEGNVRGAWAQFRATFGGTQGKKARDVRLKQLTKKAKERGYELAKVQ